MSRNASKQRIPVQIERYYRQTAGSGKGEIIYSESRPRRADLWTRGKRATDTVRRVIVAPTDLPGLLSAVARQLRQPASETRFSFHRQGRGVSITAHSNGARRAGTAAVAIVRDITSPIPWYKNADGEWANLPEAIDPLRTHRCAAQILQHFTPEQQAAGWTWQRWQRTDHEQKVMISMKTNLAVLSCRQLTAADAKTVQAFVTRLIEKRRKRAA